MTSELQPGQQVLVRAEIVADVGNDFYEVKTKAWPYPSEVWYRAADVVVPAAAAPAGDEATVPAGALRKLLGVAAYVSRGRSFVDVGPYPDATARAALGELADVGIAATLLPVGGAAAPMTYTADERRFGLPEYDATTATEEERDPGYESDAEERRRALTEEER